MTVPDTSFDIDFQHRLLDIPEADLRTYGSPHFDRRTVGEAITRIFRERSAFANSGTLRCPRDVVTACNQAYPEAAVVDPLADLDLWQEWRAGIREFPYLGRCAPLGLFHQPGKTSSA